MWYYYLGGAAAIVAGIRLLRPEKPGTKWGKKTHRQLTDRLGPHPPWMKKRRNRDPNNKEESTTTVVTGAAGFVGRHLVDALMVRGDKVIATDREAQLHRDDVFKYVSCDIRDKKGLLDMTEGADVVYHNASLVHTKKSQRKLVWDVNLGGSKAVLEACLKNNVKRLIYISSASVNYDGADIEGGDESLPYAQRYMAHYAASKIEAEKVLLAANGSLCADGKTKLLTCALRPHVIVGPGDQRFMPAMLERSLNSCLRVKVGYSGDKLSDFTFVTNLTDACLLVDENLYHGSRCEGQPYFVTNGEPENMFTYVNEILALADMPRFDRRMPDVFLQVMSYVWEFIDQYIFGGRLNSEMGFSTFAVRYLLTHHYFSIDKARRDFGYEPRIPLSQGKKLIAQSIRDVLEQSRGGAKVTDRKSSKVE